MPVATLLADSPPAPQDGRTEAEASVSPSPAPSAGAAQASAASACPKCTAQLDHGQDWCLQFGSGAPGSVASGGWRPLAAIVAATTLLVLAAAAAGYTALGRAPRHPALVTATVAQVTPAPASPATTPAPAAGTPAPVAPLAGIAKPPTIPLKAATPAPVATTPASITPATKAAGPSSSAGTKTSSTATTGGAGSEPQQEAILLDTNAATTYNPYSYPASEFGDPSMAIDGDTSTGWTAKVNPATAPAMAEGLLIDLKTPQKLSAVAILTTTPGMTVQIYGANGQSVPASITAPAWVPLSHLLTLKKRQARIGLREQTKAYRYVTLWVSKAPAASVGTPQAPGRVTVNEFELFPAG